MGGALRGGHPATCHSAAQPHISAPYSGYFRETLRRDIRRVRELFRGEQLSRELRSIQQRLDSVELLSLDIVVSLLLSYRDAQVGTASPSPLLVIPHWPHCPQTVDEPRRFILAQPLETSQQDYDSIISLVDTLHSLPTCDVAEQPNVRFHYAFALSR